jgi:carboxyl-terminal processing protease
MRTLTLWSSMATCLLALSCGHRPDGLPERAGTEANATTTAIRTATATPTSTSTSTKGAPPAPSSALESDAPFRDGARTFETVRNALLHRYAGKELTEEALYRAAVQGMLEHADPSRASWNKLLSPDELEALRIDLRGEVVGIGVQINFDEGSGYTDVLSVFPGSPSEKAGLLAGDKILNVGGKLYKGKTTKDVLADIRGKAGEPVTLAVLRGDKVSSFAVTRGVVAMEVVESAMLPDAIGYVRIRSFSAKTRPGVDRALDDAANHGARRLVIDLRGNPGGAFDAAVATAEAFLPSGAPIGRMDKPGQKEEVHTASGAAKLPSVPLAVLVDHGTSSGGEFVAAALQESRAARLVGSKTFGKWSVQTLDDLPNGYAAKYTVATLRSGSGRALDGVGLAPDVEVDMDPATTVTALATDSTERLDVDAQLRTAVALLKDK